MSEFTLLYLSLNSGIDLKHTKIENFNFNLFLSETFLVLYDSSDPGNNFLKSVSAETTKDFDLAKSIIKLKSSSKKSFSILHLNITSANENFEYFKNLLTGLILNSTLFVSQGRDVWLVLIIIISTVQITPKCTSRRTHEKAGGI